MFSSPPEHSIVITLFTFVASPDTCGQNRLNIFTRFEIAHFGSLGIPLAFFLCEKKSNHWEKKHKLN